MKAYFISDLHLGAREIENPQKQLQMVTDFLKRIQQDATHLFIVGDFFDFWFEYRTVIPKQYFPILVLLQQLTEKQVKIHYLAGNHDFALGSFFTKYLSIKTYPNEATIKLKDKKFFLHHGDGIDPKDHGYRLLKRILRNSTNQRLFRFIHPDFGIGLAKRVSGTSRKYNHTDNEARSEEAYKKFAEQKFNEGFDYVIMGHRHNPLVYEVGAKKYINLGDWITHYTYALFNGEQLQLLKWDKIKAGK